MKKIGIMGGTFNPIHFGHLFLAENAYEQIGLDKVLFMPSKNPPHKDRDGIISDSHRANMIKLAIENNPHFTFSEMELKREGITYTADTLTVLTKENKDSDYYFIIGADSLFMLQTWKNPKMICNLCTLVVAGRDQVDEKRLNMQAGYLKENYGAKIIQIDMPTIQISSELIRERIALNKDVRYYLPDNVIEYIKFHHIYMKVF